MKQKRFIALGVFGVIAVATIIALSLLQRGSSTQEQTLPDGTVVVFRGYDYGKTHRLVLGNLWQRTLAKFLPNNIARKTGATVLAYTNSSPVLLVWMELRPRSGVISLPMTGTGLSLPLGGIGQMANPYVLTDDDGTEFTHNRPALMAKTTNGSILGIPFPVLPRSSANLQFRLLAPAFPQPNPHQARFAFPNPVFAPGRAERPPSYPITATCSNFTNLTFTLVALTALSNIQSGFTAMRVAEIGVPDAWMKAQYRVRDSEGRGWTIQSVRVEDRAGGSYVPLFRDYGSAWPKEDGPVSSVDFACGLNTREPWGLHFQLRCSGILSNDLYTARSVPVPGTNSEPFTPIRVQLHGITVVIRGFTNPLSVDRRTIDAQGSMVSAAMEPPDDSYELSLVNASSVYGARIPIGGTQTGNNGTGMTQVWVPSSAKHVDLTYALTKKAFVDMIAQPTVKP